MVFFPVRSRSSVSTPHLLDFLCPYRRRAVVMLSIRPVYLVCLRNPSKMLGCLLNLYWLVILSNLFHWNLSSLSCIAASHVRLDNESVAATSQKIQSKICLAAWLIFLVGNFDPIHFIETYLAYLASSRLTFGSIMTIQPRRLSTKIQYGLKFLGHVLKIPSHVAGVVCFYFHGLSDRSKSVSVN